MPEPSAPEDQPEVPPELPKADPLPLGVVKVGAPGSGIAPVRWTPMTLLREVFAYAQVTSTLLT